MMDEKDPSNLNPTDKFFRTFQRELAEISEKIEGLGRRGSSSNTNGNDVDDCQASISQLSNEVMDASSYIPAHDKRIYSEAIKGLQQKLKDAQTTAAPRQKFSFKSGRSNFAAKKTGSAFNNVAERRASLPTDLADASDATQRDRPTVDANESQQPSSSQLKPLNLSNETGEHIFLATLAISANLSMLRRCAINLNKVTTTTEPFANLTLKKIQESLIICSHVNGPVHLTEISNSVIVVSSRQFRMHESRNCDIYLQTTSRPIIENCSNIRFAPLPEIFKTEVDEKTEDQWQHVDDFNWHRSEPSPHWSVLEASERVAQEVWSRVVSKEHVLGVDDVLNAVSLPA